MMVGQRLRELRKTKRLSQLDIEKRTGIFRCYISQLEHGFATPSIKTLAKLARALEIPLYRLFYEHNEPAKLPRSPELSRRKPTRRDSFGVRDNEVRYLNKLHRALKGIEEPNRRLLIDLATRMVHKHAMTQFHGSQAR